MKLQPWNLAYDYMTPSGRMTDERLRQLSPKVMAHVKMGRTYRREARSLRGELRKLTAAGCCYQKRCGEILTLSLVSLLWEICR